MNVNRFYFSSQITVFFIISFTFAQWGVASESFTSDSCPRILNGRSANREQMAPRHNFRITTTEDQMANIEDVLALRRNESPQWENEGFFGPHSMMWKIYKYPNFLFGLPQLYLELAMPGPAEGVYAYSQRLRRDPIVRLQKTFEHLWEIIYGSVPVAKAHLKKVYAIHSRITGPMNEKVGAYASSNRPQIAQFAANEIEGALWIHATTLYFAMKNYEILEQPLTKKERNQLMVEFKHFVMIFSGIPGHLVPGDWDSFERYWQYIMTSGELEYSTHAKELEVLFRNMAYQAAGESRLQRGLIAIGDAFSRAALPDSLVEQTQLKTTNSLARIKGVFATAVASRWAAFVLNSLPAFYRENPKLRMAQDRLVGLAPSARDLDLYEYWIGNKKFQDLFSVTNGRLSKYK